MNKRIYLMIMVLLLVIGGVKAQTVDIHEITATPGAVQVQVDMLNYTDVAAISLYINYDTDLLSFTNVTNTTLTGGWTFSASNGLINILYQATPLGTGYPINGKLLDLNFNYTGGFASDLTFTNDCEIVNSSLAVVPSTFLNGSVSNNPDMNTYTGATGFMSGYVDVGELFSWPLIIQGNPGFPGAFQTINSFTLHLSYDPAKLTYQSITSNPALTGIVVTGGNGLIHVAWSSPTAQDLSNALLGYLNFTYNGGGAATLSFEPGSVVTSGATIQNTYFVAGTVDVNPTGPFDGSITISQVGAAMGTVNVNVPVVASGLSDNPAGAINFKMTFDPAELTYKGYTANQFTGWVVNQSPAGTLNFIKTSTTPLTIADGALVTLKFDYLVNTQADITFMGGTSIQSTSFAYIPTDFVDGFISGVEYALTVSSNNALFGSVTGSGNYLLGASVPITATPLTGYHFVNWTGTGAAYVADVNDPTTTVTMPAMAIGLTANFAGYDVSGVLKYANPTGAARPITSSTVDLKTSDGLTTLQTTTSDASGNFTFTNVPDGNYKVVASTAKAWGGLTLADYAIVRNFVNAGTPVLAGIYWSAADVNLSSTVTLADYAIIRNRVNTGSTAGWTAPNWIIPQVSVSVSGATVTGVNVLGICSGDVNTSYTPPL